MRRALSRRSLLAVLALAGALSLASVATASASALSLSCSPASVVEGGSTTCTASGAVGTVSGSTSFASDFIGESSTCTLAAVSGIEQCSTDLVLSGLGDHHIAATASTFSTFCIIPGICFPMFFPVPSDPFTVTVTEAGSAVQPDNFISPLPPVVTGLSASTGTVGTPVVISGDHFETAKKVFFGTQEASIVTDGYQRISAVAPAGVTGTVDVTVVNRNGTSESSPADQFTYDVPPTHQGTAESPDTEGGSASAGAPICAVPNLVGKTRRGAKKALVAAGCLGAALEHRGHARHGRSHVRKQTPVAGTPLYAGDRLGVTLG